MSINGEEIFGRIWSLYFLGGNFADLSYESFGVLPKIALDELFQEILKSQHKNRMNDVAELNKLWKSLQGNSSSYFFYYLFFLMIFFALFLCCCVCSVR